MTTYVLPDNGTSTDFRVTNSFFGAGFTTGAEIEAAKIIDGRTDASAADDIEGGTDYSGFLSSPPALDVP